MQWVWTSVNLKKTKNQGLIVSEIMRLNLTVNRRWSLTIKKQWQSNEIGVKTTNQSLLVVTRKRKTITIAAACILGKSEERARGFRRSQFALNLRVSGRQSRSSGVLGQRNCFGIKWQNDKANGFSDDWKVPIHKERLWMTSGKSFAQKRGGNTVFFPRRRVDFRL